MSKDIYFFHGAALTRLVKRRKCTIEKMAGNSAYTKLLEQ